MARELILLTALAMCLAVIDANGMQYMGRWNTQSKNANSFRSGRKIGQSSKNTFRPPAAGMSGGRRYSYQQYSAHGMFSGNKKANNPTTPKPYYSAVVYSRGRTQYRVSSYPRQAAVTRAVVRPTVHSRPVPSYAKYNFNAMLKTANKKVVPIHAVPGPAKFKFSQGSRVATPSGAHRPAHPPPQPRHPPPQRYNPPPRYNPAPHPPRMPVGPPPPKPQPPRYNHPPHPTPQRSPPPPKYNHMPRPQYQPPPQYQPRYYYPQPRYNPPPPPRYIPRPVTPAPTPKPTPRPTTTTTTTTTKKPIPEREVEVEAGAQPTHAPAQPMPACDYWYIDPNGVYKWFPCQKQTPPPPPTTTPVPLDFIFYDVPTAPPPEPIYVPVPVYYDYPDRKKEEENTK